MDYGDACKTFRLWQVAQKPLIYRFKISSITGNSYLLYSDNALLMIDPPVRSDEECESFCVAVRDMQQTVETASIIFTHSHEIDFSLVPKYFDNVSIVYIGKHEKIPKVSNDPLQYQNARYRHEGYPQEILEQWDGHTEVPLLQDNVVDFAYLEDGDVIAVGSTKLHCIETPGHTSGHICLFHEEEGILFSGDTVLYEMLPCVSMWDDNDNEIEEQLESLKKLKKYAIQYALPAHGSIDGEFQKRLGEIESQYYMRILHMYRLVYDYPSSSAYDLCKYFYQNSNNWGEAIPQKKWHAMGEALSFLNYLRNKNYVKIRKGKNGLVNLPGKNKLTDN